MNNDRIKWIDVVKFFGIFAIYLGHIDTGMNRSIVFCYHVPLFFLVSGCMENLNKEKRFKENIKKKVKKILIPFYVFSIISIIIEIICGITMEEFKSILIALGRGNIRNTFVAGSLWFLSCLFIIEILFSLLKKVKFKSVILLICVALHLIANILIKPNPIVVPHFIYNIDSALYYIIYYAIGYAIFPYIEKLFQLNTIKKKYMFVISGVISFLYFITLFLGKDYINVIKNIRFIPLNISNMVAYLIRALIIIWFFFVLSKLFENSSTLSKIGRETLYLCGSEYIIKKMFISFISIFGLKLNITNSIDSYIYTTILIVLAYKYLNPIQKEIISKIQGIQIRNRVCTKDGKEIN